MNGFLFARGAYEHNAQEADAISAGERAWYTTYCHFEKIWQKSKKVLDKQDWRWYPN